MKPIIILIAGASGSGKSTVVDEIIEHLGKHICAKVSLDMFYHDQLTVPHDRRSKTNFDHPDAIDWEKLHHVVAHLQDGQNTKLPHYDFKTHTRIPEKALMISPRPIIIVEGIMVLWDEKLREMADYMIFVDTPLDTCLSRRIKRDVAPPEEGGRGRTHDSVITQWEIVRDMYLTHFEPTKIHAHLIIPRGGKNDTGVRLLIAALHQSISEST